MYDPTNTPLSLLSIDQQAVRDDNYKLARQTIQVCGSTSSGDMAQTQTEFYQVNENAPIPVIDKEGTALCQATACPSGLSKSELEIFNRLTESLNQTLASKPACPGDGNLDVNLADVSNWFYFSTNGVPSQTPNTPPNTSSWYDFNHDGSTDRADLKIIRENFGNHCKAKP